MTKMLLTPERLNLEYLQWMLENLGNRNKDDLRFSQYIDIKYEVTKHPYYDDYFYIEDASKAYDLLHDHLRESNVKNTL
jgi:hypothetical protein